MFIVASAIERFGLVLLVLPLFLFARSVRRLAGRPDHAAVRRSARRALILGLLNALGLLAWVAAAVVLAVSPVGQPRSLLAALLLAGPVAAASLRTVPTLLAAARHGAELPAGVLAAAPVVLPARLLPAAAGAAAVVTAFAQPTPRLWGIAALALVAVFTTIDTVQQARRIQGLPPTARWSPRTRFAAPAALLAGALGVGVVGAAVSALPPELRLTAHLHGAAAPSTSVQASRDVIELTGAPMTGPVRSFTLVADEASVALQSGARVEAWAFAGGIPGPELRVRQGDTVQVRLVNRLDSVATTLHWHGVDVPNAMDGVAGVTQDAVPPGGEFVYRFAATRAGTYWYHAHQTSSEQVARGLFGALVVEPATGEPAQLDRTVLLHTWDTDRGARVALGVSDMPALQHVSPGTTVRLRVANTDSFSTEVSMGGAPFRLVAVDGQDLHAPSELTSERIAVGGGARIDLAFTMPGRPVRLSTSAGDEAALVLTPDGTTGLAATPSPGDLLDITRYGEPAAVGAGDEIPERFDREARIDISEGFGFQNGALGYVYSINGRVFPDVPPITVREGELVKIIIANGGLVEHPMHLHGHHVRVLSRDATPVSGSPIWLDTVLVQPGEVWELALRADNPGVWMDHCHILFHAAAGMMLHVEYEGVQSNFDAGAASGNVPE